MMVGDNTSHIIVGKLASEKNNRLGNILKQLQVVDETTA
jgi:hypothetical protein